MAIDYEDVEKLNHIPSISRAFFAARLSVSEHLNKIKRKAGVLILRDPTSICDTIRSMADKRGDKRIFERVCYQI